MSDDRTWGVLASQSDEDALRNHITGTADEFHATSQHARSIGNIRPAARGLPARTEMTG